MPKAVMGLDTRMLEHTGIGTYIRNLLSGFSRLGLADQERFQTFGKPFADAPFAHHVFNAPIYSVQEQIEYPFRLKDCLLWHAPHYNAPMIKGKTKLVVTVHDLIHWVFRKDYYTPVHAFYTQRLMNRIARIADRIITVSQNTKEDLIRYFRADPEKISVIYEAVSDDFRPCAGPEPVLRVREKFGLPEKYFLYVGTLKPHKNVHWLIRLFRQLKADRKINASLVIVGRKEAHYPRGYEDLSSLKSDGDIFHFSAMDRGDLIALYNGAVSLIHPSLYEGFGLTLLESMACGTPVIALECASIPEVAGVAACLIDSSSNHDMMQAIIRMDRDTNFRHHWRSKGLERVRQFSWDSTAKKTYEVYEEVLSLK